MKSDDLLRLMRNGIEVHGTAKSFAAHLGISPQYLNDVLGEKRGISPNLADKLGYRVIVTYEPKETR